MLKVENLHKIFRTEEIETIALNGVSFEVNEGEFVAIMGPSGCGKSTLLNILGLLDNPTSGSYMLLDREVSTLREKERTRFRKGNIGFVFQSFNLIDELNVFENVELPLIYLRVKASERKRRVNEILSRMNISHRASHFPQQLSGGQQQRVAIARAVVSNPKLILADEPTGNLDSKNGREVMELLSELNREGTTVIMVTHSQYDSTFAHRVLHLFDGELVKDLTNRMSPPPGASNEPPREGSPPRGVSLRVARRFAGCGEGLPGGSGYCVAWPRGRGNGAAGWQGSGAVLCDGATGAVFRLRRALSRAREPVLEVVDAELADQNLAVGRHLEVDGQPVVEPQVDVLHGAARDEVLPVDAEEARRVEAVGQLVERVGKHVALAVAYDGLRHPVGDAEVLHLLDGQRQQLVPLAGNQEVALVVALPLQAADKFGKRLARCGRRAGTGCAVQRLQLVERPSEVGRADGLEQVVDAVDLEGPQRILVVGRGEDNGAGDAHVFENLEGRAVGQMDVHEDDVGRRVALEPGDALRDAVQRVDDLGAGSDLLQKGLQVAHGRLFILND